MTPLQPIGMSVAPGRDHVTGSDHGRGPSSSPSVANAATSNGQILSVAISPVAAKDQAALAYNNRRSDAPNFGTDAPTEPGEVQPIAPLKSFAKIPTQIMAEITKLREEAAETKVQGQDGRLDPTPMPAGKDAIGVAPRSEPPAQTKEAAPTPPKTSDATSPAKPEIGGYEAAARRSQETSVDPTKPDPAPEPRAAQSTDPAEPDPS